MAITWLASYPRSGNTFLRRLLYSYIHGPADSSGAIAAAIPAVDDVRGAPPRFCKTHYLWSEAHPLAGPGDRAIVVVRNPRDVLLSNGNYMRFLGLRGDWSDTMLARDFILHQGSSHWLQRGYGSLPQHLATWRRAPIAKCLVRYESLLDETAGTLRRLLAFLEIALDEARLQAAVTAASFAAMRQAEQQELGGTGPRFVDKARRGETLDALAPGLDLAFDRAFAPLLAELNYPPPDLAAAADGRWLRRDGHRLTSLLLCDGGADALLGLGAAFSGRSDLVIAGGITDETDPRDLADPAARLLLLAEGAASTRAALRFAQADERVGAVILAQPPADALPLIQAAARPTTILCDENIHRQARNDGMVRWLLLPGSAPATLRGRGGPALGPLLDALVPLAEAG